MKKAAPFISYLFHPLLMPSLGLLVLLNSGTYLDLLDPAAKRAIIFVMALGTLVFPLMMLPVLQYRSLVLRPGQEAGRVEKLVPQLIIFVLYLVTFLYFRRLPLSKVIHAYVLSVTLILLLIILLNLKFSLSMYTAGLGGLSGLLIALMYLYQTPLQGLLMLTLLAGGIAGSSRLALGDKWEGLLAGFLLGFAVILITILVY